MSVSALARSACSLIRSTMAVVTHEGLRRTARRKIVGTFRRWRGCRRTRVRQHTPSCRRRFPQGQSERSTRMAIGPRVLPAIAIMTAALTAGTVAVAQTQPQQQQRAPQLQAPKTVVSDKEIQAFAAAATEVRQLNQKWIPQVQQAAKQG